MSNRPKAVGMYSGGLDSILAVKVIMEEGFEVIALHFYTGFNGILRRDIEHGPFWKWSPEESVIEGAQKLGINLVALDVTDDFIDILLNPRYGYGSAANPCIDCRIFTLGKANEIMKNEGASFVFTGEVLGQRPMSQHKNALELVAKRSGLEGRLLRPLSAKHLDPTIPEKEGVINRDHLLNFHGRSRKPQMELAKRFGINWYPNAGPGCLLTDKIFAKKFKDLIDRKKESEITRLNLMSLKTGRHLRLDSGIKVIIGRTEEENNYLEELLKETCWMFETPDFPGAAVFAFDNPTEIDIKRIAAICARYGKGIGKDNISVIVTKGNTLQVLTVIPANQKDIVPYVIT
ncbi:MAG: hypothetical protein JXB48_05645 [Candidatus Latescibacteria bacterium]|nr:hypothetical protein [Candidatus Latescibacterota bacterium]